MLEDLAAKIAAVAFQLDLGERVRTAHQGAVHPAAPAARAGAVLHGLDLHVVPVLPDGGENAAVVRHVAVPVGGAFPDAHGGQVRGLLGGHVPLVDGVVGDAAQPDLAVAPGLAGGPFDAVVEVPRLARGEVVDEAR